MFVRPRSKKMDPLWPHIRLSEWMQYYGLYNLVNNGSYGLNIAFTQMAVYGTVFFDLDGFECAHVYSIMKVPSFELYSDWLLTCFGSKFHWKRSVLFHLGYNITVHKNQSSFGAVSVWFTVIFGLISLMISFVLSRPLHDHIWNPIDRSEKFR